MHPLAIAGSIGSNGGFIGGRIIRLLTATALVDRRSGLRFRHRSDAVMNVLIAIASFLEPEPELEPFADERVEAPGESAEVAGWREAASSRETS